MSTNSRSLYIYQDDGVPIEEMNRRVTVASEVKVENMEPQRKRESEQGVQLVIVDLKP